MSKKPQSEIIYNGYKFENIIKRIFEYVGYEVVNQRDIVNGIEADLILKRNEINYVVEVKYFSILCLNSYLLSKINRRLKPFIDSGYKPLVVISNSLDKTRLDKTEEFKWLENSIIDIHNLLYMVKDNDNLKSSMLDLLDYSTDDMTIEKPNIDLDISNHENNEIDSGELINELNMIQAGKECSSNYEKCCTKILRYLFESDLGKWGVQENSNDNLYRFDLICKIKRETLSEFWDTCKSFYKTKYIIFEFKNYTKPITQQQVYTTEKYLYKKALRSIAVIISREGIDKNGLKASKDALRESGKLILTLDNRDLVQMIKIKGDDGIPSDYMSDKLDDFLLKLEK